MKSARLLACLLALLFAAGGAAAQTSAPSVWASYRDTYRSMVMFEKYGSAKSLIEQHLQIAPRAKGASLEGLQLTVSGKSVRLNLALDAAGRAVFPLLKAAYDENAALLLNREPGLYAPRARVSIMLRPDGVYQGEYLRAACEQVLGYQRYIDASARSKKCIGVRLAFARKGVDATARVRKEQGANEQQLVAADGALYADESGEGYKVINLRFDELPEKAQVLTTSAPLAISALID